MATKRRLNRDDAEGSLAFAELASTDPAATRSFLEKVFGWDFEAIRMPMGDYLSFRTQGGGRGGIRPTQPREPPASLNYVRVEDLEAARELIEGAGGEIVMPRVDLPGMGSFFWFRAPGGPLMACWQDEPRAKNEGR